MINTFNLEQLDWSKNEGIIPVIIQDINTGQVLMLGYMNTEALLETLKTNLVTFYSRSRRTLWQKGMTSGNILEVKNIVHDCDQDSLLIQVNPAGPVCHKGAYSCFQGATAPKHLTLNLLENIISKRAISENQNSYTQSLLTNGINKIAQKIGEECIECVIAALNENDHSLCNEIADLLYHILVLLNCRHIKLIDVYEVLRERMKKIINAYPESLRSSLNFYR